MPPVNPPADAPAGVAPNAEARPVVALVADLIFSSKVTATAQHLGVAVVIVRTADALRAAAANAAGLLIDLNVDGIDGAALIAELKRAHPALPILGFLSHIQVDLARAARAAGADDVVPRSQFSSQLPQLLLRYAGRDA